MLIVLVLIVDDSNNFREIVLYVVIIFRSLIFMVFVAVRDFVAVEAFDRELRFLRLI